MKLSQIKKGVRNVTVGAWVKDIPIEALEGVAFRVRGARNPDALRLRGEMLSDFTAEQRTALPAETVAAISAEVIARTILTDWNLTDDDDQPIPFGVDAVLQVLTDPEIGETMRAGVAWCAAVVAQQGAETLETDAKN